MMETKQHYPALRVVCVDGKSVGGKENLCSASSFSAASPLGAELRPCSRSLTDDAASPIDSPISASVIPFERRSEIREAHVIMAGSLRHPVDVVQRHAVTEFRQNTQMPKYVYEKRFALLRDRVRHWREKREYSKAELAELAKIPYSSLGEIENSDQASSKHTPALAKALRINAYYLATDEGDPEDLTIPAPAEEVWPITAVTKDRFLSLDETERELAELQLLRAIEKIEANRSKRRGKRPA
jgi:transcriptional regulator with XRE-family HTH domain